MRFAISRPSPKSAGRLPHSLYLENDTFSSRHLFVDRTSGTALPQAKWALESSVGGRNTAVKKIYLLTSACLMVWYPVCCVLVVWDCFVWGWGWIIAEGRMRLNDRKDVSHSYLIISGPGGMSTLRLPQTSTASPQTAVPACFLRVGQTPLPPRSSAFVTAQF